MSNCPFCERDPYHYVDIGVGYEAVAVTCCELGIALFDRREKPPEEITLTWDEFTGVADTIARLRSELDQARGMVERAHDLLEDVKVFIPCSLRARFDVFLAQTEIVTTPVSSTERQDG